MCRIMFSDRRISGTLKHFCIEIFFFRKQDPVNGNWIINLSKEHSKRKTRQNESLPVPKQFDEIKTKILTLKELLKNHGWPEAHLLTKARLFGGCYTDILEEEMKGSSLSSN